MKNPLWRTFEIKSNYSVGKTEKKLSRLVIREHGFRLFPYSGKVYGKINNRKFILKYRPLESSYMSRAGSVHVRGKIVKNIKGSKICGRLTRKSLGIWLLLIFWTVMTIADLVSAPINGLSQWIFGTIGFSIFLFSILYDEKMSREGERKILAVLKRTAK